MTNNYLIKYCYFDKKYRKQEHFIANSKIEAFIQFVYTHINSVHQVCDLIYADINVENMAKEYYGLDDNLIQKIKNMPAYKSALVTLMPEFSYVKDDDKTWYIDLFQKLIKTKKKFCNKLFEMDRKFLLTIYNRKWFTIDIEIYNPKIKITFICINRIMKKVRNNNYKHILRLF